MTDGEERSAETTAEEMTVVVVLGPTTVTASSGVPMIVDRHVVGTVTGSRGARMTAVTVVSESRGARTTAVMEESESRGVRTTAVMEVDAVDSGVATDLEETMERRARRTGVQSRVRSVRLVVVVHQHLVVEIAMHLGQVTETVMLPVEFLAMVPHVLPESVAFPVTDLVGIHAMNARPGRITSGRMCARCESEELSGARSDSNLIPFICL